MEFEKLEDRQVLSAMSLLDFADADTHTVASGDWSDPTIWSSGVPTATDDAYIQSDHAINLINDSQVDTLKIDGQLWWKPDADITFTVDTILVDIGGMYVQGTESDPVTGQHRTIYRDAGPIDTIWDPTMVSRGLISSGTVEMHGNAKTSHVKALDALAGDTSIVLAEAVGGWQVGDTIAIAATKKRFELADQENEVRTITAIDFGRVVHFDDPLAFDHVTPAVNSLGGAKPFHYDVANLSRSIEYTSENTTDTTRQGHTMLMSPSVDIRYAAFDHIGRTDSTLIPSDPDGQGGGLSNPRGRYGLHFHRNGLTNEATVTGSVVSNSPGWGFVNHASNVTFLNNVGWSTVGSHFVTEAGDERGGFYNNLAIHTPVPGSNYGNQNLSGGTDQGREGPSSSKRGFGSQGHGFWMQSTDVALIDNTVSGAADEAFIWHGFKGNSDKGITKDNVMDPNLRGFEAYASGTGLAAMWLRPYDHHSADFDDRSNWDVISGIDVWNAYFGGIRVRYSHAMEFRDGIIHRDPDAGDWSQSIGHNEEAKNRGISSNANSRHLAYANLAIENFKYGILTTNNGLNYIDNVTIDTSHHSDSVAIGIKQIAAAATYPANELRTKPQQIHATDVTFVDTGTGDKLAFVGLEADLTVAEHGTEYKLTAWTSDAYYELNGQQLWRYEQAADGVPFDTNVMNAATADWRSQYPEYLDKTMQQLATEGLQLYGGEIADAAAVDLAAQGIKALGV